jgi:hypothetical protein
MKPSSNAAAVNPQFPEPTPSTRESMSFAGGAGQFQPRAQSPQTSPYHASVYVLTHHRREPLEMGGGTTFTFVTDGPDSALAQAR